MGGYGAYVWTAYLVSAATIAGLSASVLLRAARARKKLRSLKSKTPDAGHG